MSNYEAFKNLTAGIQSIGVGLAVVIGGIWSLYTFFVLRLRKKAEAELFEQAVLDITIEAKQEHLGDNKQLYVAAIATVKNKGNRNTFLDFRGRPAFEVAKVRFEESGRGIGDTFLKMEAGSRYLTLRRGASWHFPVLLTVPERGFYLVSFSVRLSDEELQVHDATAHDSSSRTPGTEILWGGKGYVVVC